MKTVVHLSQDAARGYVPRPNSAMISIVEPLEENVRFACCNDYRYVFRLEFLDTIDKGDEFGPTENVAKELLDIAHFLNGRVDHVVVHCHAGVSRSAATALLFEKLGYSLVKNRALASGANELLIERFNETLEDPIEIPEPNFWAQSPCWGI